MTALGVAVPPASAAAVHNDHWQNAEDLGSPQRFLASTIYSNEFATTQANEPLAFDGLGYCSDGVFSNTSDDDMGRTLWYRVTGTGGPITLSTRRSDFDTMLAVYNSASTPTSANHIRCDDDGNDFGAGQSELVFQSQAGVGYLVQVGGWHAGAGVIRFGNLGLDVYAAPGNDQRASAYGVTAGTAPAFDNFGATTEAEPLACGTAAYGKTVWFRWVAPATGDAIFTASSPGLDTVLSLYEAGAGAPLGCSDDSVGSGTSSRVSWRVRAGQTYEIQVGGYGAGQSADDGEFNFGVEFTQDFDIDDDGQSPPTDCNDFNDAIKRGVQDVKNGIDDDCDGIVDPDADEDGFLRPPLGADCNDGNPAIHPNATEIRGNLVDENCDGVRAPFRRIRAEVDFRGLGGRVVTLRAFIVKEIPRRARVSVVCKKPGGGTCGRKAVTALTRRVRIRGLDRLLRPGSVIQVRVTKRGFIGFYQRITIRSFAAPKYSRPGCMYPGSRRVRTTCKGIR